MIRFRDCENVFKFLTITYKYVNIYYVYSSNCQLKAILHLQQNCTSITLLWYFPTNKIFERVSLTVNWNKLLSNMRNTSTVC